MMHAANLLSKVVKFPTYSVILPSNKKTVNVNALTLRDQVESLATATTDNEYLRFMTKLIYSKIIDAREVVGTYEDFVENSLLIDRDALIVGIMHATLGGDIEIEEKCDNCGKPSTIKFDLGKTLKIKIPIKNVEDLKTYSSSFEIKIDDTTKMSFKCSYPTINDYLRVDEFINKNYGSNNDVRFTKLYVMVTFLPIKEIVVSYESNGKIVNDSVSQKDLFDFLTFIEGLPVNLIDDIKEKIKIYSDTEVAIEYKYNCKFCSTQNEKKYSANDIFLLGIRPKD